MKFAEIPKEKIAELKKKAEDVASVGDEIVPDLTIKLNEDAFSRNFLVELEDGIKNGESVDEMLKKFDSSPAGIRKTIREAFDRQIERVLQAKEPKIYVGVDSLKMRDIQRKIIKDKVEELKSSEKWKSAFETYYEKNSYPLMRTAVEGMKPKIKDTLDPDSYKEKLSNKVDDILRKLDENEAKKNGFVDESAKKESIAAKELFEAKAREFNPKEFPFLPQDKSIFAATELKKEELDKLYNHFAYQVKITSEERKVIREYTDRPDLNDILRLNFEPAYVGNSFVKADILKKTLLKSELQNDYLLSRTTSETLNKFEGGYSGLKVGERFTDRGVVSTTLKPPASPKVTDDEWYLIEARKGDKGRYVGGITQFKEQAEVALAPDTIFEVVEEANPAKGIPMRVRIVGTEETPKSIADAWDKVVDASKFSTGPKKSSDLLDALEEYRKAHIAAVPKEKVEKLKQGIKDAVETIFTDKELGVKPYKGHEWMVTKVLDGAGDEKPGVLLGKLKEEVETRMREGIPIHYEDGVYLLTAKIRLDPDGVVLRQELGRLQTELIRSKLDVDKIVNENLDRVVNESIEAYANSTELWAEHIKARPKMLEKLRKGLAGETGEVAEGVTKAAPAKAAAKEAVEEKPKEAAKEVVEAKPKEAVEAKPKEAEIEVKPKGFKPEVFPYLEAADDIFSATEIKKAELDKLSAHFAYQSKITDQERAAIRAYTDEPDLNNILRSDQFAESVVEENAYQNADFMKKALERSKLQKDYLLSRTTGGLWESGEARYGSLKVGEKFSEKGVTSTTLRPAPDTKYAEEEWYQIEAPEGTPGMYVGEISQYTEQAEVILATDLIYEVVQKANPKKGIPMRVRVVGREKTPKPVADAWDKVVEESKSSDLANKSPGLRKALDEWRAAQIEAEIPKEVFEAKKQIIRDAVEKSFHPKKGVQPEKGRGRLVVLALEESSLADSPEVLFENLKKYIEGSIREFVPFLHNRIIDDLTRKVYKDKEGVFLERDLQKFEKELLNSKLNIDEIVERDLDRVVRESIEDFDSESQTPYLDKEHIEIRPKLVAAWKKILEKEAAGSTKETPKKSEPKKAPVSKDKPVEEKPAKEEEKAAKEKEEKAAAEKEVKAKEEPNEAVPAEFEKLKQEVEKAADTIFDPQWGSNPKGGNFWVSDILSKIKGTPDPKKVLAKIRKNAEEEIHDFAEDTYKRDLWYAVLDNYKDPDEALKDAIKKYVLAAANERFDVEKVMAQHFDRIVSESVEIFAGSKTLTKTEAKLVEELRSELGTTKKEFKPEPFSFLQEDKNIFAAKPLKKDELDKLSKHFSYQAKVTDDERTAIRTYTNYPDLNDILRNTGDLENISEKNGFVKADTLKKVILKSELQKDYLLSRTTSQGINEGLYAGLKVGEKFVDRGVVSATLKPSPKKAGEEWYQIEAPEGTPGMYVGDISQYTEQAEVALGSDLIYEVIQQADPKKGIPMRVRVIGREEPPKSVLDAWDKVVEESKSSSMVAKSPGLRKALDEWKKAQIAAIPKGKVAKLEKEIAEAVDSTVSDLGEKTHSGKTRFITTVLETWANESPKVLYEKLKLEIEHYLRDLPESYNNVLHSITKKTYLDSDGIILRDELSKLQVKLLNEKLDIEKLVKDDLDRLVRESIEEFTHATNLSDEYVKIRPKILVSLKKELEEQTGVPFDESAERKFRHVDFSFLPDDGNVFQGSNLSKAQSDKLSNHFNYQPNLTAEERKAIHAYTADPTVNEVLREGKSDGGIADIMKDVLLKNTLQDNYLLSRTTSELWSEGGGMYSHLKVGDKFSDKGVTSTTLKPMPNVTQVEEEWFQIEAPAGSPGLYVRDISEYPNEVEVILATDTEFEVIVAANPKKGIPMRVRIVPRKGK